MYSCFGLRVVLCCSGARANLNVGGGHLSRAKYWEKILSCPSTSLALEVQIFVLVSALVMVSTVWSVYCLLFCYSQCPLPCPMESVQVLCYIFFLALFFFASISRAIGCQDCLRNHTKTVFWWGTVKLYSHT